MEKKVILKGISLGATVVGAIISIVGTIASTQLNDLELDEKVRKAIEELDVE